MKGGFIRKLGGKLTESKAFGGMGFRDFLAFNQAMLAKQYWRIIQNQDDYLVSRPKKTAT